MPIEIRPFVDSDIPLVAQFNRRMDEAKVPFQFPGAPDTGWLPQSAGGDLYVQPFVAVEDQATVRGGYCLKWQPFQIGSGVERIPCYQLPMTEGAANTSEAMMGVRLLKHALAGSPRMMALGMGGWDPPLPRMLKSMRWTMVECPFLFRVFRPFPFLRNIAFLRRDPKKRVALDVAAFTGAGWLGVRAVHAWKTKSTAGVGFEKVNQFGPWADEIWEAARGAYSFIAVRLRPQLETLYPPGDPRFHKIRVTRSGAAVGWAVVMCTRHTGHKHFGEMTLGSLVDCLAKPGEERAVVQAATRRLRELEADLAVTNLLHTAWVDAVRANGYLGGPSNFVFAASPKLAEAIADPGFGRVHMTRGDGDGPIHL